MKKNYVLEIFKADHEVVLYCIVFYKRIEITVCFLTI